MISELVLPSNHPCRIAPVTLDRSDLLQSSMKGVRSLPPSAPLMPRADHSRLSACLPDRNIHQIQLQLIGVVGKDAVQRLIHLFEHGVEPSALELGQFRLAKLLTQ
jgi:hypothetical protein